MPASCDLAEKRVQVGLHQLLPYFCDFLEAEIKGNMRDRALLLKLLSLAQALLDNRTFNLEPYLHQLMPSVLTCVVGKHLCRDPMENHWMVRQHVSFCLTLTSIPSSMDMLLHCVLRGRARLRTHTT